MSKLLSAKPCLYTSLRENNKKLKREWRRFGTIWRVYYFDDRLEFRIQRLHDPDMHEQVCAIIRSSAPLHMEFWPRFCEAGQSPQMDWRFLKKTMGEGWYIMPTRSQTIRGVVYKGLFDYETRQWGVEATAGMGKIVFDLKKKRIVEMARPKTKAWNVQTRKEINRYIARLREQLIIRANLGAFGTPLESSKRRAYTPSDSMLSELLSQGDRPEFEILSEIARWCASRNAMIIHARLARMAGQHAPTQLPEWKSLIVEGIRHLRDRIHVLAGSYAFEDTPSRPDLDGRTSGAQNLELFPTDDF